MVHSYFVILQETLNIYIYKFVVYTWGKKMRERFNLFQSLFCIYISKEKYLFIEKMQAESTQHRQT